MRPLPHSVLLAYPPEMFNGGTQTYFQHRRCHQRAVHAARTLAAIANGGIYELEDFEPLLCIEGHHDNQL